MEKFKEEEEERVKTSGDHGYNKNLIFIKQIVSNACGTIAVIHSVANNLDR